MPSRRALRTFAPASSARTRFGQHLNRRRLRPRLEGLEDRTLLASADLLVTKVGPATVIAGSLVTYTLTMSNQGPDAAVNVEIDDSIPAGTSFSIFLTSAPGFNTAVNSNNTQVRATGASLASGGSAVFTLIVIANTSDPSGSTISNTATVSNDTPDPNGNNNSATFDTTVQTQADMEVTKAGPASAIAGTNMTYTMTATNHGPSDAQSVTLLDDLPASLVFVDSILSQGSGVVDQNNHMTVDFGTIPSGGHATATIIVQVKSNTPDGNLLFNEVVENSTTPDPNVNNNTSTAVTSIMAEADVSLTKTGPATGAAGSNVTYTLTVTNNGPSDAQQYGVNDTPPAGTTGVSLTQISGPAPGTPLPAGQSAVFEPVLHIDPNLAGGTVLTDSAFASSTTADPNSGNNTATFDTTVITQADLSVTKISSPNPVLLGSNITYTVTVTNNGPSDAQNVVLTDPLPAGTAFVSELQSNGPSFTLGHPNVGVNGTISNTIASLPAGATASFQIVVQTQSRALAQTTVFNTATVSSTTTDPNTANNSATSSTQVFDQADLEVGKAAPPAVLSGDNLTYSVAVTNHGPIADTNVVLIDAVPANTTFVSATQGFGPAFTLGTPPVGGTGQIAAQISSLPAGALATFQIVVRVNASAPNHGDIVNTAQVSGSLSDPNTANNTATVHTTAVTLAADLAITGSVSPGPLKANGTGPLVYTITVRNMGPDPAQNVQVVDALPPQVAFAGETHPAGWSNSHPALGATGTVSFSIASLAPGATAVFTIVTKAPPLAAGTSLSDTATVSTSTFDPSSANNIIVIPDQVK